MSNLLDSIKGYITPTLISQAATMLGESENGVSKAVGGMAPAILAGIMGKAGDSHAMGSIFNMLSDGKNEGFLDNIGSLLGGGNLAHNDPKDTAGHLMGQIFGNKVPSILNALSSFAGIKSDSTSSLLGMVGPLVMGILGKKISGSGLNVSGLFNLLDGEKSSILAALPGGLSSVMGLASNFGGSTPSVPTPTASTSNNRWLLPLLLLLGLGAAVMYYLRNCSGKTAEVAKIETVVAPPTPAPAPAVEAPKLAMAPGTQEAGLLGFIMDANAAIDKKKWFDFPEIMFDVNSAILKPEGLGKLNSILMILKEHPNVKIKVGGYTDSDGDDKKNMTLSDQRAKACAAWLVGNGIVADRLQSEGYGEQHPVAANDTPENKAKNRRISVNVTAK